MPDDAYRAVKDRKRGVPEFWNVSFYHRIARETIAHKLKASIELPSARPHRGAGNVIAYPGQTSFCRDVPCDV